MKFDKNQIIGIAATGAIVIVLAIVGISKKQISPTEKSTEQNQTANKETPIQKSITREAAPQNAVIPEKNDPSGLAGVAVPDFVSAGNPNNDSSYRSFNIKIQDDAFTPNTVIVREEDTVNINFSALDRNYDFTQPDFGFKIQIKKGTTKKIQFGATASGKFRFYCASCGGPSKGPVGYVIVVQKT